MDASPEFAGAIPNLLPICHARARSKIRYDEVQDAQKVTRSATCIIWVVGALLMAATLDTLPDPSRRDTGAHTFVFGLANPCLLRPDLDASFPVPRRNFLFSFEFSCGPDIRAAPAA